MRALTRVNIMLALCDPYFLGTFPRHIHSLCFIMDAGLLKNYGTGTHKGQQNLPMERDSRQIGCKKGQKQ